MNIQADGTMTPSRPTGRIWISVDTMASDRGPRVIARGALSALEANPDLAIWLVGDEAEIRAACAEFSYTDERVRIVGTHQVIEASDHPVDAVRKKPESSLVKAIELVTSKQADGIVSAGNTGAQVAASTFAFRLLPGVRRAGIITILPSLHGRLGIMDVGANVNCKPLHLFQYGIIGSLYAEHVHGIANPRVALLSVGAESSKGSPLVKETNALFEASSLNFVGNCEGHDVFAGVADLIVCDGFVGNVVLKTAEGLAECMFGLFKQAAAAAGASEDKRLLGMFKDVKSRIDWTEVGGAQLLGVGGVSVIAHGRSNEAAMRNAVINGQKLVAERLNDRIVKALQESEISNAASE